SAARQSAPAAPGCCAVVLILEVNIRSSRTAKIIDRHDNSRRNRRSVPGERLRRRVRQDQGGRDRRPWRRRPVAAGVCGGPVAGHPPHPAHPPPSRSPHPPPPRQPPSQPP